MEVMIVFLQILVCHVFMKNCAWVQMAEHQLQVHACFWMSNQSAEMRCQLLSSQFSMHEL